MRYILFTCASLVLTALSIAAASQSFKPDDYPVTLDMLQEAPYEMEINNSVSLDKIWFVNDALDQVLIIRVATDYHRHVIAHFSAINIPSIVLRTLSLHKLVGHVYELVDYQAKKELFPLFIKAGKRISPEFFTTIKGYALGMSPDDAERIYGKPSKVERTTEGTLYRWDYVGEYWYDYMKKQPLDNYAGESWGYHVEILYQDDKAVAIIMENEIP